MFRGRGGHARGRRRGVVGVAVVLRRLAAHADAALGRARADGHGDGRCAVDGATSRGVFLATDPDGAGLQLHGTQRGLQPVRVGLLLLLWLVMVVVVVSENGRRHWRLVANNGGWNDEKQVRLLNRLSAFFICVLSLISYNVLLSTLIEWLH